MRPGNRLDQRGGKLGTGKFWVNQPGALVVDGQYGHRQTGLLHTQSDAIGVLLKAHIQSLVTKTNGLRHSNAASHDQQLGGEGDQPAPLVRLNVRA